MRNVLVIYHMVLFPVYVIVIGTVKFFIGGWISTLIIFFAYIELSLEDYLHIIMLVIL